LLIQIILFGLYREKLPKELKGKTNLELPQKATIGDVLAQLSIEGALCALNGQIEPDHTRLLQDGDQLQVFRPSGGGIQ
jgi:sulfur carrier protein ThiS